MGVDAKTVVFQRGTRNYAGPACPGKGWTCTQARHVVQFGGNNGGNRFVCGPPSDGTNTPDTCVIVQVNTEGFNIAVCNERSTLVAPRQSCTVTQQNQSGPNQSTVDQRAVQRGGDTQTASQDAKVTQTNGTGKNTSQLTQTIWQLTSSTAPAVNQGQDGEQTVTVSQNAVSGDQSSTLSEFTGQRVGATGVVGVAAAAPVSGTQVQIGNGTASIDQHSTGVSTSDVSQKMNQQATAPRGSTVVQTQNGPWKCCSSQDSNPRDTFKLKQSKVQFASTLQPASGLTSNALQAAGSSQFVSIWGELHSSGQADVKQAVTENGVTKRNTCNVMGGSCFSSTTCPSTGACTTCTSTEFCCPPTECCTSTDCCPANGCSPSAKAANRREQARERQSFFRRR